ALVGAALLGLAPAAFAATGAAATSPQAGLARASSELGSLAASARTTAARTLLRAAQSSLESAAVPSLWIDARHSVAPAYGATVFAQSRTALVRLEHVASADAPAEAVAAVERSVLASDRSLAIGAIRQATGGVGGGLLARAAGLILSGDRWSETSRLDLGAVQYGAASRWAFEALRETVELRAQLVSTKWLGLAGEKALGRGSVAPAG